MLKEKEKLLIKELRENSRITLVDLNKKLGIPVSTLAFMLKKLKSNVILKHYSVIDNIALGYNIRVNFEISALKKEQLKEYLTTHPNINTLSTVLNGIDYIFDAYFKTFREFVDFKDSLNQFEIKSIEEKFILEELKSEGFILK